MRAVHTGAAREPGPAGGGRGLGDCAEVLSEFGETVATGMPEGFAEEAAKPERVIVLLQGDTAQASVTTPGGGLSAKRTSLRRIGPEWLIDQLGVSRR